MRFEQPPGLNRYVDNTIPLTWAVRWRCLKPVLPLLLCASAFVFEQVAFRFWLNDRNLVSELPLLVVCACLPVFMMVAAFEVLTRITQRSKRSLELKPERVFISPAKYNRIPWGRVSALRLEPIPGTAEFSKLTLSYSLGKGSKWNREWPMVLRRADQEHELISELEHLRQRGLNSTPLERLSKPAAPKGPGQRLRSTLAVVLGIYCFVHGLPLLGAGLLPANRPPDESSSDSRFSDKESAKLRRVIRQTFSSRDQFRQFLLSVGGGLTILGSGLYFWGLSTPKRTARGLPLDAHVVVEKV